MSLTHGHFNIALMVLSRLDDSMKRVLERNVNAYLLGSVCHDIIYCSDYAGDKAAPIVQFDVDFERDVHEFKTGEMIVNLLDDYIKPREQTSEQEEKKLAFILGLITHWVTDIYIHTLVNAYGGTYSKNESKHIQLELVETKYLLEQSPQLKSLSISDDPDVFQFLAGAVAKTYPSARVSHAVPAAHNIGAITVSVGLDERTDWFAGAMSWGVTAVKVAYQCANEACGTGTGTSSYVLPKLAEHKWASNKAFIPSAAEYAGIICPLKIPELTADASSVTARIEVGDSALFAKFLMDYEKFSSAALIKIRSIFEDISEYLGKHFSRTFQFSPQIDIEKIGADVTLRHALEQRFKIDGQDINILEPESFMNKFDPDVMKGIQDGGRHDNGNAEDIFFSLDYRTVDGKTGIYSGRTKIEPVGEQRLYGAHRGEVHLKIPVDNPNSIDYYYTLKISLTDEKAFNVAAYNNIEFMTTAENFFKSTRFQQQAPEKKIEFLKVDMQPSAPWVLRGIPIDEYQRNESIGELQVVHGIPEGSDSNSHWRKVYIMITGGISSDIPVKTFSAEEYAQSFEKYNKAFVSLGNHGSISIGEMSGVYAEGQGESKSSVTNTSSYYYIYRAALRNKEAFISIDARVEVDARTPDSGAQTKACCEGFMNNIHDALKSIKFNIGYEK